MALVGVPVAAGGEPREGELTAPGPLAEDLAAFVRAMRGVGLPGGPRAYRGGPVASLDAGTRAAIEALRGIPEEGVDCDAAAAVWEEALRAPPGRGRRCGCTQT